jgi:hypothetical protein
VIGEPGAQGDDAPSAVDAEEAMHIHRPKPLHGVREILTEIGVVVVGIAIALSGEQLLESQHHHEQVVHGEAALKDNFAHFVQFTAEVDKDAPCVAARAAEIRGLIDAAAAKRRLPAVGPMPQPFPRPWRIDTWETMVASQAAIHVPPDRAVLYAGVAMSAEYLYRDATLEWEEWGALQSLSGPARPFSEAEEAKARDTLARAVHQTTLVRFLADNTVPRIVRTRLLDKAALDGAIALGRRVDRPTGMCQPIRVGP